MSSASIVKYIELTASHDARDCVRSQYKKNFTEVAGQTILTSVHHITALELKALKHSANATWSVMNSPKTTAMLLTAASMITVAVIFNATFPYCPVAPKLGVLVCRAKYFAFLQAELAVAGMGLRTLGRFSNEQLMNLFYKNCGNLPKGHDWPEDSSAVEIGTPPPSPTCASIEVN